MAYASSVTAHENTLGGYRGWCVVITETDAEATSEVEINLAEHGLPPMGRVIAQLCKVNSGDATTVDPILGNVTDPATDANWKMKNETAVAAVHNQPATGLAYCPLITSLFHRSNPNTGTNNNITTAYYFVRGW